MAGCCSLFEGACSCWPASRQEKSDRGLWAACAIAMGAAQPGQPGSPQPKFDGERAIRTQLRWQPFVRLALVRHSCSALPCPCPCPALLRRYVLTFPTIAAVLSLGIGCVTPLRKLFFPVQVGGWAARQAGGCAYVSTCCVAYVSTCCVVCVGFSTNMPVRSQRQWVRGQAYALL